MANGRLSHAYLLLGPEGAGKRRLAFEVAGTLFCPEWTAKEGSLPCGHCAACLSIEHGNHPGVSSFAPQTGKAVIDIDTVRSLGERSHYARHHAFVAILERADTLTLPAANALLKTLEEPPGEFIVFLTAQSSGALLPTIVSRCHRLYLPASDEVAPSNVTLDALAAIEQPEFFSLHEPRQWLSRAVPEVGQPRERVRQLLNACVASCRNALASSPEAHLDAVLDRLEALLELRSSLDGNVSPELVLEKLLECLGAGR